MRSKTAQRCFIYFSYVHLKGNTGEGKEKMHSTPKPGVRGVREYLRCRAALQEPRYPTFIYCCVWIPFGQRNYVKPSSIGWFLSLNQWQPRITSNVGCSRYGRQRCVRGVVERTRHKTYTHTHSNTLTAHRFSFLLHHYSFPGSSPARAHEPYRPRTLPNTLSNLCQCIFHITF